MSVQVLSARELVRLTGSRRQARAAVELGDWWRVVRGAYARRGVPDSSAVRAQALRVVHLDGWSSSTTAGRSGSSRRFTSDRRRHTRLTELGLEVRRFTSPDVYQRSSASVAAEVLRAVRQASAVPRDDLRLRVGASA